MSREIKFRAWDTKHKKMLNSRDQGYQGEVFKWLKEGQPLEVMQFTGMHDRTGREIYEGDICNFVLSGMGTCGGIGEVKWSEKGGYWMTRTRLPFLLHKADIIEVIGNVHENPELCKG